MNPIAARMIELGVAGVSVAVSDPEGLDVACYGESVAGSGRLVTPHTLFQAASVSKAVAVAGALRLVDSGILDLDSDVNEYLTSWQVPPVEDWQPRVSIRQLMSHYAGMTVHGFPGYPRNGRVPSIVAILDGAEGVVTPAVRVDVVPGTQWRYSGGGTTVLQLVMCDVTGVAFPDLMRELVLAPAGMTTATFGRLSQESQMDAASGHVRDRSVPGGWHEYPEMAAAGLWCTPTDLCRFGSAMQDSVQGRPGALISRELATVAITPVEHGTHPVAVRGSAQMGLGFFVTEEDFGHDGRNEGFLTRWTASVAGDVGVAVMSNSDTSGPILQEIADAALESRGCSPIRRARLQGPMSYPRQPGRYRADTGLLIVIGAAGSSLSATIASQPPAPLSPVRGGGTEASSSTFVVDGLETYLAFDLSGDGPARSVTLRQSGQDIVAARQH